MTIRNFGDAGSSGSTLLELAIVVSILGLLMGSLLPPLATRYRLHEIKQAEGMLRETKDALLGFAVVEGRLPWPDTDSPPDGLEDPALSSSSACPDCEGFLPWRTLGTVATDPWGRLYRYRVTRELANPVRTGSPPAENQLDLLDVGNVRIYSRDDALRRAAMVKGAGQQIALTAGAAAAVMSPGYNGWGGTRLDGTVLAAPPPASDEAVNLDGWDGAPPRPHFYAGRVRPKGSEPCDDSTPGAPVCAFDDLVVWIPVTVLLNRLVTAGRLP